MELGKNAVGYRQIYNKLLNRILKGGGQSLPEQRQAAFDNAGLEPPLSNLIGKVANYAYKITNDDIDTAKRAGNNEDQLFELIICGAVGQASRQYESGLVALAAALEKGGRHAS